ncbi:MAG: selenium metabolism hydrolase [Bdellovibrionales bacterium RIFOXYD12_FULL_39_22]|nr:MAG: selenium metabolism hydrolase [Bdellovibrionales bacterium RIFOXYB1_FULL_39_21]OFZ43160.1 MAG: selenium metabolism hydrolase [Bdellovibrionales bacterium RIFOXYC12_FULL_39_17]OFZ47898.1 MAG: selenium metabolism hydrolase [Bdellovibrionales bacterium RIFOXYC1_FULL_39_130]OFZ73440.1 MAG: selenium metabolism hydrolase [Bdellovibrionales bacterium RIFOXYC2_FULL_39_8]OFZ75678.1 MAG: selenium metabolism hydrolase [Bdellovibrionales bacterium RIFOXYD1_FULL_39_84]OFZ94168.1 MAG: selenium metab
MLDAKKVMSQAYKYEEEMTQFLRDMIAIPSESCQEKEVIERIKKEMKKVGFDEIKIDKMGNILGRIGNGPRVIAMDAHIDTVGIGDPNAWKHGPYQGKLENGIIYGRGASDQEGGMASMVYAGKIIKDLKLEGDYTLWVVGSVQEEDCDGLCWQYILKENVLNPRPEVVIITEPTNLNLYRGHRGRMEIGVTTNGVSCHGSAPERGKNAVYMMAKVVNEIEKLNERIRGDDFLGKGTVTVSYIDCKTPSLCAVPDRAYIHLDRRLTKGETKESAIAEVKEAVKRAGVEATVEILNYEVPSYTGLKYPTEKYYPTWVLDENHKLATSSVATYEAVFGSRPKVDKWTFSTNGIATMGMMGIPTMGFGPGNEIYAHSTNDQMPVEHLVKAAAFYAAFPTIYCK